MVFKDPNTKFGKMIDGFSISIGQVLDVRKAWIKLLSFNEQLLSGINNRNDIKVSIHFHYRTFHQPQSQPPGGYGPSVGEKGANLVHYSMNV